MFCFIHSWKVLLINNPLLVVNKHLTNLLVPVDEMTQFRLKTSCTFCISKCLSYWCVWLQKNNVCRQVRLVRHFCYLGITILNFQWNNFILDSPLRQSCTAFWKLSTSFYQDRRRWSTSNRTPAKRPQKRRQKLLDVTGIVDIRVSGSLLMTFERI